MKYLQRYLSLLFALVMCVGLFSITAHAEQVEYDNSHIYVNILQYVNDHYDISGEWSFTPNDQNVESKEFNNVISAETDYQYRQHLNFYIMRKNQEMLIPSGGEFTLNIENMCFKFVFTGDNGSLTTNNIDDMGATIYYTDGTVDYTTVTFHKDTNNWYDVKIKFTPVKDVQNIYLTVVTDFLNNPQIGPWLDSSLMSRPVNVSTFLGEIDERGFRVSIYQDSEEVSLLQGVIDRLTNGFKSLGDNLTSGFKSLGDKLTNVFNSIVELPEKLWQKISDGLKSLFVPSEESMIAYKDKWDELLASRFGAVYQVVNILTDSWDGIMQADMTDTIQFPKATLNFSGTPFSFGGYDVKIVPDGFGALVTAVKSIVAIVCTVAFVNGLRKRYDEVMGVEQ